VITLSGMALWAPQSPDLMPPYFFRQGLLKDSLQPLSKKHVGS
jgi:hypothetical protein